jgi:hypothetical protein
MKPRVRWSLEHGADYLLTIKATNQPCANRSKSWLPPSMRIFPSHEPTPTKARRSAAGKEKDLRCGIRCDNALTIPPLPLGVGLLKASRAITPSKSARQIPKCASQAKRSSAAVGPAVHVSDVILSIDPYAKADLTYVPRFTNRFRCKTDVVCEGSEPNCAKINRPEGLPRT